MHVWKSVTEKKERKKDLQVEMKTKAIKKAPESKKLRFERENIKYETEKRDNRHENM